MAAILLTLASAYFGGNSVRRVTSGRDGTPTKGNLEPQSQKQMFRVEQIVGAAFLLRARLQPCRNRASAESGIRPRGELAPYYSTCRWFHSTKMTTHQPCRSPVV